MGDVVEVYDQPLKRAAAAILDDAFAAGAELYGGSLGLIPERRGKEEDPQDANAAGFNVILPAFKIGPITSADIGRAK
jgi:hypothetical protein